MLADPVSAPSCALLGVILWAHPDRLTDAPADKHTEPRSSVPFRAGGRGEKCVKVTNMQTSWQPQVPEVLIMMMREWAKAQAYLKACVAQQY